MTRAEIANACALISDSGAHAVATGTDFWPDTRVSVDDVKALREALGPKFIIKAAGNLRDRKAVLPLIEAGASRIGTTHSAALFKL